MKTKFISLIVLNAVFAALFSATAKEARFASNPDDNSVIAEFADGKKCVFKPDFMVLMASENPERRLRRGSFLDESKNADKLELLYNIPTWGGKERAVDFSNMHVEDGFNPELDRGFGEGRTANYFKAASRRLVSAVSSRSEDGKVFWTFPETEDFSLEASVDFKSAAMPKIEFKFVPKKDGWYSVGYVGSPATKSSEIDEIFQPLIWQEKRFPNLPYLSESFRCTIPTALVCASSITTGAIADLKYIPFEPLPNRDNSLFGVLVRDWKGDARSSVFAPVFGGKKSQMKAGEPFSFELYLYAKQLDIPSAYRDIAVNFCGLEDIRRNSTCNLNTTIDNVAEFCLGEYGGFIKELRGCNYSTDVPGAVKNISGLLPLETALIMDDESVYKNVALPMLEFGLSRERFLFSTNDKIKGQNTSSRLNGPGVPMSDLSTAYIYSSRRNDYFLSEAEKLYGNKVVRSINLDAIYYEDRWQNAMFLYDATKESKYLEAFKKDSSDYLAWRVAKKQTDFFDPLSMGMFFWTSFTNQWMELYYAYLKTGDKRFLDAAEDGAMRYTQFCWSIPKIPEGNIVVNKGGVVPLYRNNPKKYRPMKLPETSVEAWKVSEIGLTPESSATSSGHRGIFMAHHAPFMMRIAADTNNQFLRTVARNAVVGRYEGFPGYHINAGRTNAFELRDFAKQPQNVLNAHTSIHYNHPWSHLAMLWDYLVSDFYYVSGGKINFPPEYAEGYAYCRSFVYGAHKGSFYGHEGAMLYMPSGAIKVSNIQANYISAYGGGNFYAAFANQSPKVERTEVVFNPEKCGLEKSKTYQAELWRDNEKAGEVQISGAKTTLEMSANGVTALVIKGVNTPVKFQKNFFDGGKKWSKNHTSTGFHKDRAVMIDFGRGLKSVYVWNEANNSVFSSVTLHYALDGKWQSIEKKGYPYEFSIPVSEENSKFEYRFSAVKSDSGREESMVGELVK